MSDLIYPLGDYVLVKPIKDDTPGETKTRLILNTTINEDVVRGEVLGCGPGLHNGNGGYIPLTVRVGNIVLYSPNVNSIKVKHDGSECIMIHEYDIYGIVNRNEVEERKSLLTELFNKND